MSFLGLFDYPKEIRQLQHQLPKSDRDAVMATYKKLSGKNKDSFKQALRNADVAGASAILNKDLTQYNLASTTPAVKGKSKGVAHTHTPHTHPLSAKAQKMATGLSGSSMTTGTTVVGAAILPAEVARRYAVSTPPAGQTLPPVAGQANLVRIDSSGVFAFPDATSMDKVKNVLLDGKVLPADKYAVIDNGNVDVFESNKNSVVSVSLK